MFVDNIRAILNLGLPMSQINWSVLAALETVIVQEADTVCSSNLAMNPAPSVNMLTRHAYLILYPLAGIASVSSELYAAVAYHVVSFAGLLFAVFCYLRKKMFRHYT